MTLREALNALHLAGRIRSPWLPGMRTTQYGVGTRLCWEDESYWHACDDRGAWLRFASDRMSTLDIDPSDPATVGCLAALAREASGNPHRHVYWDGRAWSVDDGGPRSSLARRAASEGAAWAGDIIAMAEALP